MSFLQKFKRGEVKKDYVILPTGDHEVSVDEIAITNDRQVSWRDGRMKAEADLPEWNDAHDQLAVKFIKKDELGKTLGVITERYNSAGFTRYEELDDEKKEEFFMSGDEGYAVNNETKHRLEDPARTAQCLNILNELFAAAGVPVGTKGVEAIVAKKLQITVYERSYKGDPKRRVKNPKAVVAEVAEAVPEETAAQEY